MKKPHLREADAPSLYVLPFGETSVRQTERALLGALILDHAQIEAVAGLDVEDLHYLGHRGLLRLLRRLAASRVPWDLTTILDRLRGDLRDLEECGGDLGAIADLPSDCPSTELLSAYVEAIQEAAARNRLRRLASKASESLLAASSDSEADLGHAIDLLIADLRRALPARTRPVAQSGPEDMVWRGLAMTEQGVPRPTPSNLFRIFRDDSRWKGLRLNLLGRQVEQGDGTQEDEVVVAHRAAEWLSDHYDCEAGIAPIQGALLAAAQTRAYHPVREYLAGLVWDGEPRIARVLTEVLGCPDSRLHQAYLRRFLIGSVARACEPGVKFDTALIFVGAQAAGKSTFFARLYGRKWFGDSPIPIGDKDAFIQLATVWCYEAAEMEDISKKTAEAIKQFLSGSTDVYRAPYDREARHHPRHSVMVGTTNKPEFLTDETGHRRFWPITIPDHVLIRLDLIDAWRDQLWAEAAVAYHAKEPFWLTREESVELARDEDIARYTVEHPWTPMVEDYLKTAPPRFKTAEVLRFGLKLDPQHHTRGNAQIVTGILTKLKYRQDVAKIGGVSDRSWVSPTYERRQVQDRDDGGWVP